MAGDYKDMGFWSQIEVHVGNVCACMPAIYSLLKRKLPALLSAKESSSPSAASGKEPKVRVQTSKRDDTLNEADFVRLDDMSSRD
jgi:hypothetical protein